MRLLLWSVAVSFVCSSFQAVSPDAIATHSMCRVRGVVLRAAV
jgi:hypothetical protein